MRLQRFQFGDSDLQVSSYHKAVTVSKTVVAGDFQDGLDNTCKTIVLGLLLGYM